MFKKNTESYGMSRRVMQLSGNYLRHFKQWMTINKYVSDEAEILYWVPNSIGPLFF